MSLPRNGSIATETSPLLADAKKAIVQTAEIASGVAVDDAPFTDFVSANGGLDGGDLEQQRSCEAKLKQYDGMPEVRKKMKYVLPAIAIGVFLSAADQTIIVSSYGKIGSELKSLNNMSWIATAYFVTLTAFQPLYGKLSDIFGRKECLLFSYFVFGLGCLFCGLAENMEQLIAARAFAGIGGGGMTTVVSILLSDTVPLIERGTWQGYINIIYATGAGAGGPLGGVLADSIGWRWSFLAQAPLCLIAFLATSIVLKLPQTDHSHWKAKLRRIDFLGAILLVSAVFTLLLGLDRGSNVGWTDPYSLGSLLVSLPLFAIFVLVETKVAHEPFAPRHIIFERSLVACYACNFFSFSGWLAAFFYLPLYFQVVHGYSASDAGLVLIAGIVPGVCGSLFGGFYMQKTGRYFWLTFGAYLHLIIGMGFIVLFSGVLFGSTLGMCVGMMICGFSNGIGVTTTLISLIANASPSDQAIATACSYLFRSLGSVSGVSLSAAVANQVLRSSLQRELKSGDDVAQIVKHVRESISYIRTLEPEIRAIVEECYARSARSAFALEITLVVGAAVAAWYIKEKRLNK